MKAKSKLITQEQLAKMLGVSRQLIGRYQKRRDAPPLDDVDAWIEYIEKKGSRQETLPAKLRAQIAKQRIRLLKAQADKAEGEEAVRRGEYVLFTDVAQFFREVSCVGFIGEWDRMSREIPPLLVGLSAPQIHIELQRERDRLEKETLKKVEDWIAKWEKQQAKAKKEDRE